MDIPVLHFFNNKYVIQLKFIDMNNKFDDLFRKTKQGGTSLKRYIINF